MSPQVPNSGVNDHLPPAKLLVSQMNGTQSSPLVQTQALISKASQKCLFITLPPELHLQIFGNLTPIYSQCLGLTCKQLMAIHCSLHPEPLMLELDSIGETIMNYNMTRDGTNIHILWKLLEKWMVQTGNLCKTARWLVL